MSLIEKLFNKNKDERILSADEIKPLFESQGIDMEKIGFPFIETRNNTPTDAYAINFKDVNMYPIKTNGDVSLVIKGKYITQPIASYKVIGKGWLPGSPSNYNFIIKNGELNIK